VARVVHRAVGSATASATDSPVQTRGPHRLHQRDPAGLGHYPRPSCVNPNLSRGSQASPETGHMTGPCPGHGSVRNFLYSVKAARSARRKPDLRAALGRRPRPGSRMRASVEACTGSHLPPSSSPRPVSGQSGPRQGRLTASLRDHRPLTRSGRRSGGYEVDGSDSGRSCSQAVAKDVIDLEHLELAADRTQA
jgi:hypothetical protein